MRLCPPADSATGVPTALTEEHSPGHGMSHRLLCHTLLSTPCPPAGWPPAQAGGTLQSSAPPSPAPPGRWLPSRAAPPWAPAGGLTAGAEALGSRHEWSSNDAKPALQQEGRQYCMPAKVLLPYCRVQARCSCQGMPPSRPLTSKSCCPRKSTRRTFLSSVASCPCSASLCRMLSTVLAACAFSCSCRAQAASYSAHSPYRR